MKCYRQAVIYGTQLSASMLSGSHSDSAPISKIGPVLEMEEVQEVRADGSLSGATESEVRVLCINNRSRTI